MSVLIVIPARYASTRYPGKPLVPLTGATGVARTLVERSWRAAREVAGADRVVVATDDARIRQACEGFGAEVVMTSEACGNGTERCAEAHAALGGGFEIVVNLQGDAPLTPPWFVEELIAAMKADPEAQMATPVLQCDAQTYAMFVEDRRNGRVGGTTAVFGQDNRALYFSKEIVPYIDPNKVPTTDIPVWHHVGVYAYRPSALAAYVGWPETRLEKVEGLEQLRFLVHGMAVRCVEVSARGRLFWELNNPADVARIEKVLAAQ